MGGADVTQANALDRAIDNYGVGRFQIILGCIVGMCIMADGAEMLGPSPPRHAPPPSRAVGCVFGNMVGLRRRRASLSLTACARAAVLSLVNQALTKEWGITSTQRGLLGSSIFVGFLIGSITSALCRRGAGQRRGTCQTPLLSAVHTRSAHAPPARAPQWARLRTSTAARAAFWLRTPACSSLGSHPPLRPTTRRFSSCAPVSATSSAGPSPLVALTSPSSRPRPTAAPSSSWPIFSSQAAR